MTARVAPLRATSDDPPWTEAEGLALCHAVEAAFPVVPLPEGTDLVWDPRDDDAREIVAACRGKTWRELDGRTVMVDLRPVFNFTADAADCSVLPAFLYQAVVASAEYRSEIQWIAAMDLDFGVFDHHKDQSFRERHQACVARRMLRLSAAQRWVAREFLRLSQSESETWSLSAGARFWDSVVTTGEPQIWGAQAHDPPSKD